MVDIRQFPVDCSIDRTAGSTTLTVKFKIGLTQEERTLLSTQTDQEVNDYILAEGGNYVEKDVSIPEESGYGPATLVVDEVGNPWLIYIRSSDGDVKKVPRTWVPGPDGLTAPKE